MTKIENCRILFEPSFILWILKLAEVVDSISGPGLIFLSTFQLLGLLSWLKPQYCYKEASLQQTNQENRMLKIN